MGWILDFRRTLTEVNKSHLSTATTAKNYKNYKNYGYTLPTLAPSASHVRQHSQIDQILVADGSSEIRELFKICYPYYPMALR